MDWKDALAALNKEDFPEGGDVELPSAAEEAPAPRRNYKLNLVYEKKGRAGKPATIIAGFPDEVGDDEILDVARSLKQKMGCGGSARGGEILLQGDRREQAAKMLREMGFRI